jgi:membrane protease YdiL (CAAX protease family)
VPGAALLLLLVYFAASAVVLLIGDSLSDEEVGVVFFAAAAVIAPLAAAYVGLVRHAPDERTAAALRIDAPHGRAWLHVGLGLLCGMALAPLASALTTKLVELLPKDPSPNEHLTEWLAAVQQPATQVLIVLCAVTREILFRGFMLPRLVAPAGLVRAITLVSLFDLSTQPLGPALVVAVPLGILALAARSTWPSIVASVAILVTPVEMILPPNEALVLVGSAVLSVGLLALAWRLRVPAPVSSA